MQPAATPARLSTSAPNFEAEFQARLFWSDAADAPIEQRVSEIVADVRLRGDAAVLECTNRFDGLNAASVGELEIGKDELRRAFDAIAPEQREALLFAARRVRSYHEAQKKACGESWSYRDEDGSLLGQKVTALDRVGIYVPGGKAAYPSSVLMNAIPAHVAGVGEIIMVVPTPAAGGKGGQGERNALVLAAAHVAGVTRVFTVGGAQAVAALAFGTRTIPKVDKITGPGNAWVAAAKRRVFGTVGIDMIAGPSEVLVIADSGNDPDWIALDLLSQAEHDESAQAILITDDAAFGAAVTAAVDRRLLTLERRAIAGASWRRFGAIITVRDLAEAAELSDRIAPEHLQLCVADPDALLARVSHAGAIFLGSWTPEAIGDYVGGPNHVLPTSRSARFSSGLSVLDFLKRTTISATGPAAVGQIGPAAARLARAEGLEAHALSVEVRLAALNGAKGQG